VHESVRDAKHKYGSAENIIWFTVPDYRESWAQTRELSMAWQLRVGPSTTLHSGCCFTSPTRSGMPVTLSTVAEYKASSLTRVNGPIQCAAQAASDVCANWIAAAGPVVAATGMFRIEPCWVTRSKKKAIVRRLPAWAAFT
jgi:hypothetical protein